MASLRLDHTLVQPDLIASLPPERVVRLPVGSMSAEALHRLIQLHTGRTVQRPVLQRIHEVTDGNPFYALELVQSLTGARAGRRSRCRRLWRR